MFLYLVEFILVFTKFFGLKTFLVEVGYFFISFCGRIGRSTKFPEQVGHTFSKISRAHSTLERTNHCFDRSVWQIFVAMLAIGSYF